MLHFSRDFNFEETASQKKTIEDAFAALLKEHKEGLVGYYDLPKNSLDIVHDVKKFTQESELLSSELISDIAVIGIGGSSLGIKAVDSFISSKKTASRKLHFFENSDPLDISQNLAQLEKKSTLFVVISKSGSTIETTSIFKTVLEHFHIDLKSAQSEHIVVITDKGSSLSEFAKDYKIKQFNIPNNVGGRFSVLSAVGVVPLTLAGYDTLSLLKGADAFVERFFQKKEKHILQKACFMYEHSKEYPINVVFSYATHLQNLTKWYVQLWGESLGKIDTDNHHVGLTPIGLIGAVDQHSFLQLLIEGPKDKSVTFICIEDFENDLQIPDISLKHIEKTDFINGSSFNTLINAQCEATKESLVNSGVAVDTIAMDKINESNIGAMLIYFELLTSLLGAMFKINTYDQPGVELGKNILYEKFHKTKDN